MYCSRCKNSFYFEDKFCSECGKRNDEESEDFTFKEVTKQAIKLGYIFKFKDGNDFWIFENTECLKIYWREGIKFEPMDPSHCSRLSNVVNSIVEESPDMKKYISVQSIKNDNKKTLFRVLENENI